MNKQTCSSNSRFNSNRLTPTLAIRSLFRFNSSRTMVLLSSLWKRSSRKGCQRFQLSNFRSSKTLNSNNRIKPNNRTTYSSRWQPKVQWWLNNTNNSFSPKCDSHRPITCSSINRFQGCGRIQVCSNLIIFQVTHNNKLINNR